VSRDKQLEQFARDYYDRLFRAALYMCGREDVAQDLVQETFLAAAGSLRSFAHRSSSYTWLYGILLNKFRGWLRSKGTHVGFPDLSGPDHEYASGEAQLADDAPGVLDRLAQKETAQIVRACIQRLPAHHRSVLALRYLEEMSYAEIAKALSCSVGTVKSRVHYALRRIAGELGKVGDLER